jgi:DnaA family protein
MTNQLPLTLRWPAQQRFETFVAGDNGAALALVRDVAHGAADGAFLAGAGGSGKSHLLLAACAEASAHRRHAQYLSLATMGGERAAGIRALGGGDLLALDDVQAIAGDAGAEHALFDLYNRCKMENCTLLFAATAPPAQIGISLPDLVSRLSSCTQAVLRPLDDAARRTAVRRRAHARGLELGEPVLDWLFAHAPRDLGSLTELVERVDRAALAAQRRVTIPFLRSLLAQASDESSS